MTQKKVLALLLTLCLVFSMTVPAYAASSRSSSWPWTSSSAAAKEEPATTSSGSLVLVEDDTTVTEGTELRASTYVLTNDGSASSASADVYIEVDTSMTASELAKAAEGRPSSISPPASTMKTPSPRVQLVPLSREPSIP